MDESSGKESGLTRRQALRRAAAVGGTLVWTVPLVQSMSGSAVAAAGSVEVLADKSGQDDKGGGTPEDDTKVLGEKLPSTGSIAGDAAAIGVGALAVGAALRAAQKRRNDGNEAGDPATPPV